MFYKHHSSYHFDSDPDFLHFNYNYVRWKSGVTFVRRCSRDVLFQMNMTISQKNV